MLFTLDMKMADIIHKNYLLLSILPRFDIKLGFGDQTIEEVCAHQGVNPYFFIEIVNSFHDKSFFPKNNLKSFQLKDIVNYLRKTHEYYLTSKIPEIEAYIQELVESGKPENKSNLMMLEKFFGNYKSELIKHIAREDERVLPYVLRLEDVLSNNTVNQDILNEIKTEGIEVYETEHEDIEENLFDLKNIIIKYFPPTQNNALCNTILIELFRLERDLSDHSSIEDKVLVPKVKLLEETILKLAV